MDLWSINFPLPVALAIIATIGYLFGLRTRNFDFRRFSNSDRELRRAQTVAKELEEITWNVRKNLSKHQASIRRFKDRVSRLSDNQHGAAWKQLCREADEILKPTLQLTTQISNAYDELRLQSSHLMSFTEIRTDSLTGVNNRRGMEHTISSQLAMKARYNMDFSVAIFDIDHFKEFNDTEGHLHGDRMLKQLATVFENSIRETDSIARYGGEEFVVTMPETNLEGAAIFSERLRYIIDQKLALTVSGGVATALSCDTQDTLIDRADIALYKAKDAGRNCVFTNDGKQTAKVENHDEKSTNPMHQNAEAKNASDHKNAEEKSPSASNA